MCNRRSQQELHLVLLLCLWSARGMRLAGKMRLKSTTTSRSEIFFSFMFFFWYIIPSKIRIGWVLWKHWSILWEEGGPAWDACMQASTRSHWQATDSVRQWEASRSWANSQVPVAGKCFVQSFQCFFFLCVLFLPLSFLSSIAFFLLLSRFCLLLCLLLSSYGALYHIE